MDSVNSITRREFALGAAAFAAAGCVLSAPEASAEAGADGMSFWVSAATFTVAPRSAATFLASLRALLPQVPLLT